jgi:Fic family protein
VREVANYVNALEYGLDRLGKLPVSLRLIKEIHSVLMKGVRGSDKMVGEFRSIQNFIARPGANISNAKYAPPPPKEMMIALNEFEKYLHHHPEWPFIVELALIHYQFEAIHPFVDGNGRIGRLLISLLLCERKLLPQPLLYLSAYFERNRDRYYDLLFRASQAGAWLEWITFFLEGIVEQSKDATIRTMRMLELLDQHRGQMQKARSSALMLQLVDELFGYPAITISRAAEILGVTYRSAKAIVGKLITAGILREAEERKYNRVFVAPEIVHIIEADVL